MLQTFFFVAFTLSNGIFCSTKALNLRWSNVSTFSFVLKAEYTVSGLAPVGMGAVRQTPRDRLSFQH